MEGVRCTRNMNGKLCELDHLHLTFGRVQAAYLILKCRLIWTGTIGFAIGRQAEHCRALSEPQWLMARGDCDDKAQVPQ